MPWHITVFHYKVMENGILKRKNDVHIQVMTNNENQESSVNVALLDMSLDKFSKSHKSITKCWIRSDNGKRFLNKFITHFLIVQ